jgi:hypothetical protein
MPSGPSASITALATAGVSAEIEITVEPGDGPDRVLLRLVKRGIHTGAAPQAPAPLSRTPPAACSA